MGVTEKRERRGHCNCYMKGIDVEGKGEKRWKLKEAKEMKQK